jgi:hypothetical protein
MGRDVTPGETDDPVAGEFEVGIGGGVAFAITTGAVVGETVELDDDAMSRPERVDLVAALLPIQQDVESRHREACLSYELVVAILELASGVLRSPRRHHAAQRRGSAPATRT